MGFDKACAMRLYKCLVDVNKMRGIRYRNIKLGERMTDMGNRNIRAYDTQRNPDMLENAFAYYVMDINTDRLSADAYVGLAHVRIRRVKHGLPDPKGDIPKAKKLSEHSLKLDPDNPSAHLSLARCLYLGGLVDKSIEETQKAIDLYPESSAAHYDMGQYLLYKGDKKGAKEHLDITAQSEHQGIASGAKDILKKHFHGQCP